MSRYDEKDAARDTDASPKDVVKAWHDAREDAQQDGALQERAINKGVAPPPDATNVVVKRAPDGTIVGWYDAEAVKSLPTVMKRLMGL